MARIHEYQGKELLAAGGLRTPLGRAVKSSDEARQAATEIGGRVVLKVQAWVTGRKALGGVKFAATPDEAARDADALLGMRFGNFPVEEVLGEALRHPFSGVAMAYKHGIPPEAMHIIATHSHEGEKVQRSIESIIFHHADFVDFDIAKLLGKMAAKG